jgi:c-di-GMP-binding flagellar brake protein YcgR
MEDFLDTAIDRNAPAVLSLPSAGMFRNHKSRFLRRCDGGFWVEGITTELPLIESLIRSGEPVGISFKAGSRGVNCVAPLRELNRTFTLHEGTTIMAIRVERPATVKAVQRRADFRVTVNPKDNFRVLIWRIGDHADLEVEPTSPPLQTIVRDLSVGGVGVIFVGRDGQPPKVTDLDRLRVVMTYGSEKQFVVEGSCTTPRRVGETDQWTAGIRFVGLQSRMTGRQILSDLARIVNSLQLAERRRAAA